MWCAYCTQEITDTNQHALCRDAYWWQVCEEFTQVKLEFMKQYDHKVNKGETVKVRNADDHV
jgi:hypothetical protein